MNDASRDRREANHVQTGFQDHGGTVSTCGFAVSYRLLFLPSATSLHEATAYAERDDLQRGRVLMHILVHVGLFP